MSLNDEKEKLLEQKTETDSVDQQVNSKRVNTSNRLASDEQQMKNFLTPMLDDLEKSVAESMKLLDKMEEEFLADSNKEKYNRLVSHIPEEIRERKSIDSILQNLEKMILETTELQNQPRVITEPIQVQAHEYLQSKNGESSILSNEISLIQSKKSNLTESAVDLKNSKLDDLNNLACLSHSLTAYLITANSKRNAENLKNLTIKLYDSVNIWISRLFRFYNSSILFHDQDLDGLIRICSMLMNFKYKEYRKNGYESINKPPAIYISSSSKYAQLEYREIITIQLGLPLSAIKLVQVSKDPDHTLDKIIISSFLAQVENDYNNGFMPLILVANAGSYSTGQCDDLDQLNHICYKYKMWTHLDGIYLSTLAMYSVPTAMQPVSSGDSITLNLPTWLGVPSLSYVTLYRNVQNSSLYIQPFNSFITTLQKCLPYWCVLQAIGHDGVIQRIRYANDMSSTLKEVLVKNEPYLKIMNFKDNLNQETVTKKYTISDLLAKAISFLTFVDLNNPIIIFKCDQKYVNEKLFLYSDLVEKVEEKVVKKMDPVKEEFLKLMQDVDPFTDSEIEKKEAEKQAKKEAERKARLAKIIYPDEIIEYTDTLTTWLYDLLNSLHKNIELELIEIENEGVCIRYSPFEHVNLFGTNQTDIKNFSQSLNDIMAILDASIKCKSKFNKEIKEYKNLVPVNVPKWAGIGAVRYIPDYLLDKSEEIKNYQLSKLKSLEKKSKQTEEQEPEKEDSKINETIINESEVVVKESDILNQQSDSIESNEKTNELKLDESPIENEDFTEDPILEKYIKELNDINNELVKKLHTQDNAFSAGEASDSMSSVKFGMVNDLEAIKKLAYEVQTVGKEVEESSRFIETMSDLIRQGIEKANEDLKKENEQKLVQEGILRQIPLVSGLFNWISPPPSVNTTGRTFNLQSGKIASTETTYKYHIQVEESKEDKTSEKSVDLSKERRLSTVSTKSNISNVVTINEEQKTETTN